MTNEEVIRELKAMYEHILPYMSVMGTEAYEMAIKALEQQPCEDCISRQAIIELLMAVWTKYIPMEFPDSIYEFLSDYSFKDEDEVYSNGILLIPTFRVKQAIEHYYEEKQNDLMVESIKR